MWELVLSGELVPLCLTEGKLYGTWDGAALDWLGGIDDWVAGQPDLGIEVHTLAGWPVRRIFAQPRPPMKLSHVVRIPDLEAMPGAGKPAAIPASSS